MSLILGIKYFSSSFCLEDNFVYIQFLHKLGYSYIHLYKTVILQATDEISTLNIDIFDAPEISMITSKMKFQVLQHLALVYSLDHVNHTCNHISRCLTLKRFKIYHTKKFGQKITR